MPGLPPPGFLASIPLADEPPPVQMHAPFTGTLPQETERKFFKCRTLNMGTPRSANLPSTTLASGNTIHTWEP